MKNPQNAWRTSGLAAAVVAVVLTAGGCSSADGTSGGTDTDGKASPSASAPAADGGAAADGSLPGVPAAGTARTQLEGLKVAEHGPMTGYSRDRFPHWASQGENCDTREKVLARDGQDVAQDDQCKATSGKWTSVYDDKKFTEAGDLDIDHMVPLANAWRSGARSWNDEQRKKFANDLTHPQLLAVSASSNRSKGDQGPDAWQPPAKAYWCTYARAWTSVKDTYELTVTDKEKAKLGSMLDTCEAG